MQKIELVHSNCIVILERLPVMQEVARSSPVAHTTGRSELLWAATLFLCG